MPTSFRRIIVLLFAVTVAVTSSIAQPPETATQPGRIFAGETLRYDGKFNKLKISFSVAEISFVSSIAPNGTDLIIKGEAVSKGTLTRLFRYSFLQQYESTIDLNGFRILRTSKHDVQKERVRDSEAIFDYGQRRVTYVETDPKDKMRPPRTIASEIGTEMNDIISGIWSVRLRQLAEGTKFDIPISDSGVVYKVPVAITKRERLSTVLGKVWCLRVEPEVFGPGRLIEQTGKMVIWMTDDARHIPVKTQINASVGKIELKLKSATPGK